MKKLITAIVIILLLNQCHDSGMTSENSDARFNKEIGEEISIETARRWIQNQKNTNAREEQFSVSPDALRAAMDAVQNKLGVVLHHALDENGGHHVLIVPVKEDLMLWSNGSVLDASTGQLVDATTANIWAEAYKQTNPTGAWSHFFGVLIFEEILSKTNFSEMDIVPAQNDEGKPQLLLFVWSGDGMANGRQAGDDLKVYDMSAVCPPTCNVY